MKSVIPQALFFSLFVLHVLATEHSVVERHIQGLQHGRISPKLDPESDKVFFDHDYPDNLRGKGKLKPEFGHPYPAVQDTNEFDRDYVKDENNDGGEWKAQMEYDLLRTKLSKAQDDMEKAKAANEAAQNRFADAKRKEAKAMEEAGVSKDKVAKARAEARTAEKDASDAKEATEKAEDQDVEDMRKTMEAEEKKKADEAAADAKAASEKDRAGGKAGSTDTTDEKASKLDDEAGETGSEAKLNAAKTKVEKEMADLEKCQEELEKAKAKLKELAEKEDKLAKAKREEHEQKVAKLDKDRSEASKEESQASQELSDRKSDAASLEGASASEKKLLSEEEKAHEAAVAKAKLESTDLDKLESDLKAAEKNLRKLRRAEDKDGGVYNDKPCKKTAPLEVPSPQPCVKSGAMSHNAYAAMLSLFAAVMICLL